MKPVGNSLAAMSVTLVGTRVEACMAGEGCLLSAFLLEPHFQLRGLSQSRVLERLQYPSRTPEQLSECREQSRAWACWLSLVGYFRILAVHLGQAWATE